MNLITRSEWDARSVPTGNYGRRGGSTDVVVHHTAESTKSAWLLFRGKPGLKWFAAKYRKNRAVQKAIKVWQYNDARAFESECEAMRQMQRYHMDTNGWADLGYHYVIFPSGRVFEGRPVWAVGAHAHNGNHMVGISFAGNYEKDTLTVQQLAAYSELLQKVHSTKQVGHYRVPGNSTACPGKNIKSKLGV